MYACMYALPKCLHVYIGQDCSVVRFTGERKTTSRIGLGWIDLKAFNPLKEIMFSLCVYFRGKSRLSQGCTKYNNNNKKN